MAKILIPSIGVAMEEALLVKWLKQPGDVVAADEAVAEIETDKTGMDLTSPVSGILGPHLAEPGAIIPVGTAITEVLEEGEGTSEAVRSETSPAETPPAESEPSALEAPVTSPASGTEGRTPHVLARGHVVRPGNLMPGSPKPVSLKRRSMKP